MKLELNQKKRIIGMTETKYCKKCKDKLNGVMIFYPELCLSCVIDLDIDTRNYSTPPKDKVKKNPKKMEFW